MKVKFVPQNIEVEATPDKTLLQIATENHIEIKSICKGVPSCAECRVYIKEGEQNLVPPGKPELSLIGTSYYIDGRRLSCQVHCFGDVTVDLTEQLERAENQTKKVRGFRSSKQVESKAIQDTMILNEKVDHTPPQHEHVTGSSQTSEESQQAPAPQQRQQQQRQQQQPRQQQQNRNQNQQQQRRPQGGGQPHGQGGQQQGQGHHPQQGGPQAQKQGGGQAQSQGGGQNQNRNRRPRNNNNQQGQQQAQQPQKAPPNKTQKPE